MIDFKEELNEEQFEIVKSDCNMVLVACPGSGKTRTLTYKIIYELDKIKGTKQKICAITYTNNAADEIKERIEAKNIDTSQLWIGTIHSFCIEWILKQYSLYEDDLRHGFSIIDPFQVELLLDELCDKFNSLHGLNRRTGVSRFDCEYFFKADLSIQYSCDESKLEFVKTILEDFFKIIDCKNQIDFEGVLKYALMLIKKKPVILKILSNIFDYILVDEFQDTKAIQYEILTSIARVSELTCKLLFVGDPNQSIFATLGGFPMQQPQLENLVDRKFERSSLTSNYRSSCRVIDYFENYNSEEIEIIATSDLKDYPSLITYDNKISHDDIVKRIANLITHNIDELGIRESEICILAPQWFLLGSMTRNLVLELPDNNFNGPGMTPFTRSIENTFYKFTRIALTESSPTMYVRRLRWAGDLLKELSAIGIDTAKTSNRELLFYSNSFTSETDSGLEYLEEYFRYMLSKLKIIIENHDILFDHHSAFIESAKRRIDRIINSGIEYIGDLETFRKVFRQRSGITVSTIHGAKGLEFDTVIVFGLLDGMVPFFRDENGEINSKKLVYVAASRARKNLHLISETGRNNRWPTPVVRKVDFDYDEI